MTLIDANLLLYAYLPSSKHHETAREWLEARLSEAEPVGLPWVSILALMRISTNPRLSAEPLSIGEANQIVVPKKGQIYYGGGWIQFHYDDCDYWPDEKRYIYLARPGWQDFYTSPRGFARKYYWQVRRMLTV